MKIEDDFLDQKHFDKLQKTIMGDYFTWFFRDFVIDKKNKKDPNFFFVHMVYYKSVVDPITMQVLEPVLQKIGVQGLHRIKINLQTQTSKIIEGEFHTDIHEDSDDGWLTAILYMNTNNGYSKFEDGTVVESVANRMVTFPAKRRHKGSSCTDEKRRVVINFNYT